MSEEIKETAQVQEVQDRVFPIGALVGCLKGQAADAGVVEMLSYITQTDVSADLAPVAAGLSKGFIYEQEPALTGYKSEDIAKLGSKVKLAPLAGEELSQAQAVLGLLTKVAAERDALAASLKQAEDAKSGLEAEVASLKAKMKVYTDKDAAAENKVKVAAGKIDDMIKKLDDLQKEVEKVKSQGVVVAGVAGGAAAGGEAPAADGASGAPATGGAPEADFGFGSNPFADNDW